MQRQSGHQSPRLAVAAELSDEAILTGTKRVASRPCRLRKTRMSDEVRNVAPISPSSKRGTPCKVTSHPVGVTSYSDSVTSLLAADVMLSVSRPR